MKKDKNRVYIFDTTLRDGEQSPGCSMNTEEKLILARQLEKLGVDIIEAGFPIASEGDFDAVRQIAKEIKKSQVAGLARANKARYRPCLAGNKRRGSSPHPYFYLFVGYSFEVSTQKEPRTSAQRSCRRRQAGALLHGKCRILADGRHALG